MEVLDYREKCTISSLSDYKHIDTLQTNFVFFILLKLSLSLMLLIVEIVRQLVCSSQHIYTPRRWFVKPEQQGGT